MYVHIAPMQFEKNYEITKTSVARSSREVSALFEYSDRTIGNIASVTACYSLWTL